MIRHRIRLFPFFAINYRINHFLLEHNHTASGYVYQRVFFVWENLVVGKYRHYCDITTHPPPPTPLHFCGVPCSTLVTWRATANQIALPLAYRGCGCAAFHPTLGADRRCVRMGWWLPSCPDRPHRRSGPRSTRSCRAARPTWNCPAPTDRHAASNILCKPF